MVDERKIHEEYYCVIARRVLAISYLFCVEISFRILQAKKKKDVCSMDTIV